MKCHVSEDSIEVSFDFVSYNICFKYLLKRQSVVVFIDFEERQSARLTHANANKYYLNDYLTREQSLVCA